MTRTAILYLLLAGTVAPAQDVRMHVYYDGFEEDSAILVAPTSVRYAWSTGGLNCQFDETLTRTGDQRGQFTSTEQDVFVTCSLGQPLDAAMLPSGSFIVMSGGYVRVFNPSGTPLGPEFLVTGPQGGGFPKVAALGDRYAVTWGEFSGSPTRLKGRIVMEDGSLPYTERELPQDTTYHAYSQDIAATSSTGAMVAWTREPVGPPQTHEVMARLFDNTLAPLSGDLFVEPGGTDSGNPSLALLPSGFVVVWERWNGTDHDVLAQLLDPSGALVGSAIQVPSTAATDDRPAYCASDSSGRFVITWARIGAGGDGSGYGVYAQRFGPTGTKLGPEFRVNGTTWNDQGPNGRPAMRADGSFIIPWSSYQDPDGSTGSFFRRYYFPVSLLLAPGPASSNAPMVQAIQPDGLVGLATFPAYGAGGYGANVGAGDIDGDAMAEALTGPGPSPVYGPQVRAFRPAGTALQKVNFYAYGTLRYGVRPAGGKIDADSFAEILTAPGAGAFFGPHIRGWNYDNTLLQPINKVSFFAFGTLKYGARVAAGDIDGDGMREILVSPGPGASFGSQVRGFNYDGTQLTAINKVNFWAYPYPGAAYGATVGAADIESDGLGGYGDGYQEILVGIGPDPAYTGTVRVFDYDNASIAQKYEISPYSTFYGANVAGGDIDAGDAEEVVTAPGSDPSSGAHIICWEWDPVIGINPDGPRLQKLGPDDFSWGSYTSGANVAVGTFQ